MSRSEICIPVPTKLFLELLAFLRAKGSDRDPVDTVSTAIEYWMSHCGSVGEPTALASSSMSSSEIKEIDGYWWKKVFIPNGSRARTTYKGRTYFADVTPEGLLFGNKTTSPSGLMWEITGGARNAWRDIEFKFPSSDKWILADQIRRQAETDALK
jgi:hypothetical protein